MHECGGNDLRVPAIVFSRYGLVCFEFCIMASSSILKRKHTLLTIQNKVDILNGLEKGESGSSLTKVFGVSISIITTDIKKEKNSILNFASKLDSDDGSIREYVKNN